MKKLSLLILGFLFLSACGFHLRGAAEVPKWLTNVAIIMNNNDKQFMAILKSQLEGYNIPVKAEPANAQYWLFIPRAVVQQQIISIGASTNPRQYTLILSVEFSLQNRKGQIIKLPKTIRVTRQLTINNDRILGSTDEESILISEMKHDAAVQIINQLGHTDAEVKEYKIKQAF